MQNTDNITTAMSTDSSRRTFIKYTVAAGAGLALAGTVQAAGASGKPALHNAGGRVKTKGYAFDDNGKLSPFTFERRPMGDNDILIEIKYASICHSDIHQGRGDWGKQQTPQVPGHEIAGIVAAVGKNVTKFKVGDRAGVGCMVDSCMACESCKSGLEQHCDNGKTLFTYGNPDAREPTGITQGGYSTHLVVRDHFAVHIPEQIPLQEAAPLLCAGITTYSPLMKYHIKAGDKVGVAGIGGLGHMAVKLAVAKGAEVYAFTTTAAKAAAIRRIGVKDVIVVGDDLRGLQAYRGKLDYLIATIPVQFNVAAYGALVKPYGYFTIVGIGVGGKLDDVSVIGLAMSRINLNVSLIGGMPETQEVIDFCARTGVRPQIEIIRAEDVNQAWDNVIAKKARFRYVIDTATI